MHDIKTHEESLHKKLLRYACTFCDYKSYHSHSVKKHLIEKHHGRETNVVMIGCEKCERNEIHSHKTKRPEEKVQHKCNQCNYSAERKSYLIYHIERKHGTNIKKFGCSVCEYKTYFINCMENHVDQKHKLGEAKMHNLKCEDCENNIDHKEHTYQLAEEKKVEKKPINVPKRYKDPNCSECGDGPFQNHKFKLAHYKEKHPSKKIFKCDLCDYGDNTSGNLTMHKNTKHLKKEYSCTLCPFKSRWTTAFGKHMRDKHDFYRRSSKYNNDTTVDEKPKMCDKCGFTTFSKDKYEKHIIHPNCEENITPVKTTSRFGSNISYCHGMFKCNRCDYTSDFAQNIRKHVADVHERNSISNVRQVDPNVTKFPEKLKFKCNKCDFQTEQAYDLRSHIASHS